MPASVRPSAASSSAHCSRRCATWASTVNCASGRMRSSICACISRSICKTRSYKRSSAARAGERSAGGETRDGAAGAGLLSELSAEWMPEIFSSTLPRSSSRCCSCLMGSESSTQTRREKGSDLFGAAGGRSEIALSAVAQVHRLGGDQLQHVASAETPAPADAVARDHASLSELIHRLQVYFQQRGDFRRGHDFFHSVILLFCFKIASKFIAGRCFSTSHANGDPA